MITSLKQGDRRWGYQEGERKRRLYQRTGGFTEDYRGSNDKKAIKKKNPEKSAKKTGIQVEQCYKTPNYISLATREILELESKGEADEEVGANLLWRGKENGMGKYRERRSEEGGLSNILIPPFFDQVCSASLPSDPASAARLPDHSRRLPSSQKLLTAPLMYGRRAAKQVMEGGRGV